MEGAETGMDKYMQGDIWPKSNEAQRMDLHRNFLLSSRRRRVVFKTASISMHQTASFGFPGFQVSKLSRKLKRSSVKQELRQGGLKLNGLELCTQDRDK